MFKCILIVDMMKLRSTVQVLAFTPDWEYYVKSFGWSSGLDILSIWVTYEHIYEAPVDK